MRSFSFVFLRPSWLPLPVNGAVRRRRRGDRAERGSTFRYSSAPALVVALPVHRLLAPQAVAGSRFSLPADMVEMRAWRSARFISPYPWGIVSRKRKICLFAHSPVLPHGRCVSHHRCSFNSLRRGLRFTKTPPRGVLVLLTQQGEPEKSTCESKCFLE